MRAALLKAKAKKKKFQKRKVEIVDDLEQDSDASLSSDDEDEYSENMIGKLIQHKYLILKYLGRGSFSKVWLVLDITQGIYYALKIQEPDDLDEMYDEIDFLKDIQRKRNDKSYPICYMVDEFELKIHGYNTYAIVLELLGSNIGYVIGDIPEDFKLSVIKRLIRDVVEGIEILHNHKIIHTDMKIDNILLNQMDTNILEFMQKINQLKILDNYQERLNQNTPSQINLLDKKKRKVIKKKIRLKISKEISQEYQETIRTLNQENQNNVKLEIQEFDDSVLEGLDSEDSVSDDENNNYDWDNIKAKIIDLGNSESSDAYQNPQEMYTRSYRPPENIITKEYSSKSDIWFIGCLLYEMLTEEILFDIDIDTSDKNKRDIEHLAQMSKVLGNIPRDMAMSFSNIDELSFTINLKENINLRGKIQESVQIDENELDYLEDLMYKILEYDPEKRLSATEILQHKWFQV